MATSPEERVALARRAFEAYAAHDVEAVLSYLDPEIEIYNSPALMNAGTFHGHEGWFQWTSAWNEAWESFTIEVEAAEAVGERHLVASVHQTGRGRSSGVEIQMDASYLYEIEGGRAVYLGLYPDREAALAAAREREGG